MLWSALILVRFMITSVLVLTVPGIALQLALFPRVPFDAAERAFMILSGSVALASLVAVLLAWSPLGLHVWSFGLFLMLVVVLLGLVAAVRHDGRQAARATVQGAIEYAKALPRRAVARRNIELSLFLCALLLLVGAALIRTESSTRVTEFYFPPEQFAALRDASSQPEAALAVPVEIANGSTQSMTYRIEVWTGTTKLTEQAGIVVAAQTTAKSSIAVPPATSTEPEALEFRLFQADQPTVIARLRLQRGEASARSAARQ